MQRSLTHLLFWVAYIIFKLLINLTASSQAIEIDSSGLLNRSVTLLYSILPFMVIQIPVVYILFALIDAFFKEKLTVISTIVLSSITVVIAVPLIDLINHGFILPVVFNDHSHTFKLHAGSLLYHTFNLGTIVGAACSIKLVRINAQSRVMEQTLKREKLEAELKFLKAQISPHFLFNTLNNIYSIARKQSVHTAEAIMKLSKLLRFMLYDVNSKDILLTDELKLIEDYIELEKLRYTNRLIVTFDKVIDNPDQRIAPLLLIHFVENAFKHGAGESRFNISINIQVTLKDSVLKATFINSKGGHPIVSIENKIGLNNTKRQLELLYPLHHLTIENNPTQFHVILSIPLS